jgi:hypothetical protein
MNKNRRRKVPIQKERRGGDRGGDMSVQPGEKEIEGKEKESHI